MRVKFAGLSIASALLMAGCARQAPTTNYPMHGTVVSLDQQNHTANIKHDKIGDWMGAMTMEYPIPNKSDWQKLKLGGTFDAKVFVRGDEYYVADVTPKK